MRNMTVLLLSLLILALNACESLERITEGAKSHPPQTVVYGNPHVAQGVTALDYQLVQGIPVTNRTITVEVKRPGETEFSALNQYEFETHENYSEPGVSFKKRIILQGHLIVIPWPHRPAAPIGTEYIITATLID